MPFLDGVYILKVLNGLARDYKYCVSELLSPDIYVSRECKDLGGGLQYITPLGQFVYQYKNLLKLNCFLNMLSKTDLYENDMLLKIRCFSKAP